MRPRATQCDTRLVVDPSPQNAYQAELTRFHDCSSVPFWPAEWIQELQRSLQMESNCRDFDGIVVKPIGHWRMHSNDSPPHTEVVATHGRPTYINVHNGAHALVNSWPNTRQVQFKEQKARHSDAVPTYVPLYCPEDGIRSGDCESNTKFCGNHHALILRSI